MHKISIYIMAQQQPDLDLTDIEIAWIAGLLEGEGTFAVNDRGKTRYEESVAPAT